MLTTQAVSDRTDQVQPVLLNENLFLLREQLGRQSEPLISDDRLLTMLRVTKGDLPEATLMALRYIVKTLRLQAERREEQDAQEVYDSELSVLVAYFGELLAILQAQHAAQPPTPPAKSRGGWLPALFKRD